MKYITIPTGPLYDSPRETETAQYDSRTDTYAIRHPDKEAKAFIVKAEIRNRLQTMLKCLKDRPDLYGPDELNANDFVISMMFSMFASENRRG